LITLRGRYLCPAAAGLVSLIQARAGKRMDPKCIPVPAAAVSAS
jgi:preprotein translocase subunit Sec61beta